MDDVNPPEVFQKVRGKGHVELTITKYNTKYILITERQNLLRFLHFLLPSLRNVVPQLAAITPVSAPLLSAPVRIPQPEELVVLRGKPFPDVHHLAHTVGVVSLQTFPLGLLAVSLT